MKRIVTMFAMFLIASGLALTAPTKDGCCPQTDCCKSGTCCHHHAR